jgi:Domain of unknown function (DUF4835)
MQKNNFPVLLTILVISFLATVVRAQEFNAVITVSVPKLQETDPAVFKTLERDLQEFMSQERWTQDEYKPYERIDCNFQVNISQELGSNTYKADIAMKAIRPVYGSEYKTVLINHVDRDIIFTYQEFQPIENGTEFFKDNLSAVFSFYAHFILGLDAESFALSAGEEYFQRAQNIINQIPPNISDSDKGWQSLNRKTTRYWMGENFLSPRFKSYKEAWYNYHRKGLDIMHTNLESAVTTLVDALKEVDKTNTSYPNSIGVLMFVTAKGDEIVEIMKNAARTQKSTVYEIMRRLDPSNSGKYNAIRG